jgi:outer membrane biosynthesis protein TonB
VPAIIFPFDDPTGRVAGDRRLSIAFTASLVMHALVLAALRGLPATPYSFAEGGVGSIPALQAVLAGPPVELQEVIEPLSPEPMIETPLLAPALIKPVETTFGRTHPPTTPIPGGGPVRPGPASPEANVAVGTIADPGKLGPDYAAQLAQRFPNPVHVVPTLIGTPPVPYPRAALESGIEGRFAAVVAVDDLGKAVDAKLVVEDPLFGPVVLEALKKAEFAPAQYDGNVVPYWAIVQFTFTIGKPTPSVAAAPPAARTPARQPSVGR